VSEVCGLWACGLWACGLFWLEGLGEDPFEVCELRVSSGELCRPC
jgi:hypothetical protein